MDAGLGQPADPDQPGEVQQVVVPPVTDVGDWE
jgi:hypothetical protein